MHSSHYLKRTVLTWRSTVPPLAGQEEAEDPVPSAHRRVTSACAFHTLVSTLSIDGCRDNLVYAMVLSPGAKSMLHFV